MFLWLFFFFFFQGFIAEARCYHPGSCVGKSRTRFGDFCCYCMRTRLSWIFSLSPFYSLHPLCSGPSKSRMPVTRPCSSTDSTWRPWRRRCRGWPTTARSTGCCKVRPVTSMVLLMHPRNCYVSLDATTLASLYAFLQKNFLKPPSITLCVFHSTGGWGEIE